jgi:large subunit ribosomal protein L22
MTGPKTNEGATKVGERVGTRASVRYARVSAYKAREVLDLIRGKHVREADEILQFVERDVAIVIRKCLASAVANAQNNDAQDPDELKVVACYADEGPTLKRFRPRARGRAGRIRKRTCHITVIVGRLSEAELDQQRRREEASPAAARRARSAQKAAASRRERVARSRQAAAAAKGQAAHEHDHDHDHEEEVAEAAEAGEVEATEVDSSEVEATAVEADVAEAADEATAEDATEGEKKDEA